MKKLILFLLACLILVSLCACERTPDPTEPDATSEPTTSQPITDPTASEPAGSESTDPTEPSTEATAPATTPVDVIRGMIGQNVEDLYALYGEPESSEYAPGCLYPGTEEGILFYDGFIVYTIREDGVETIYDVE